MEKKGVKVTSDGSHTFEAIVNRVLFDKAFANAVENCDTEKVNETLKEMGVTVDSDHLESMLQGLKANDLGVVRALSGSLSQENSVGT